MVIIPKTTLSMIVRDEIMNPAGGLLPMLEKHLPLVEEAVVVDTGSLDGTRQLLEYFQALYPHLRVYDHQFDGYTKSREFARKKANTRYLLCLDADEVLFEEEELVEMINDDKTWRGKGIEINFLNFISPTSETYEGCAWNPRLHPRNLGYGSSHQFGAEKSKCYRREKTERAIIYHFRPALGTKKEFWYKLMDTDKYNGEAPSESPYFPDWRTPNVMLVKEKLDLDILKVLEILNSLGLQPKTEISDAIYGQLQ
ncbi:MAG: glycosyltransferase [archaeon]|nr:glycosyltransferase [archaeon]